MKYLYLTAALAGLFGTAFFLGRATQAPRVEYVETTPPAPTVFTKTVIRRETALSKTVYRTVDTRPDGSSSTTELETTAVVVKEGTDATSKQDAPVVPTRPGTPGGTGPSLFGEASVRVGLLAGVDVSARNGVLGAELERRLFGPVWGGVWGLSSGQVGISLKGEW